MTEIPPVSAVYYVVVIGLIVLCHFFDLRKGVPAFWSAVIAALLSLLAMAGVGHLYLKAAVRGYFLITLSLLSLLISPFLIQASFFMYALFILSAFDAFSIGIRGHGILFPGLYDTSD